MAGAAREAAHRAGDRRREAIASNNLGIALRKAGRVAEAVEAHGKALHIHEEFDDWYGVGQALHNLARTHETARRPDDVRACLLRAADAFTRANAPTEAAQSRAWAAELG
ncbi:tetratricopeptide repeat protein [Streptomyces fuscichromogenes]|uniref:tetratricopeptide repeat protein n=1 Tax=Streptomyces fuscichromogenes TaxID=1324013 RepID=UPI00380CCD6F